MWSLWLKERIGFVLRQKFDTSAGGVDQSNQTRNE